MNKKIFILGPFYPYRGGIADFNRSLCQALINLGYECEGISFRLQYPTLLFPGKTQYDYNQPKPDFKIHNLINSVNPFWWYKTAAFIINNKPLAVITAYWIPFIGVSTSFILRRLRGKTQRVALAHNIVPHQKQVADDLITKFFVNSNDAFMLLSQRVANDLLKIKYNARYIVASHPIYDIFGKLVDKSQAIRELSLPNGNYLLFFGLVKKYKGLDVLLRAIAEPEVKILNFKLIIAGEFYDNKEKYIDLIKQYDIAEKIILNDFFIPNDRVKYYFSVADAVVQPYKNATQSGVTAVAYNFNKPMIVTDVGGLREIVDDGKTGFIVKANDYKSLAQAIVKFYQQKDRIDFAKNILPKKNQLSWDNFAKKILTLVENT